MKQLGCSYYDCTLNTINNVSNFYVFNLEVTTYPILVTICFL